MATEIQTQWSTGSITLPFKFKVHDVSKFIECCRIRYLYDERGATSLQWQELAEQFQIAKGKRHSFLAEYCMRKAK